MDIKIALAGNPNCGKTTLFNALTGSSQYVGNWPGVTVEKKEGRLKGRKDVVIQDLPGIYSLSPYTLEEVVARNYLVQEKPDAILNIVDGTNIERNLYLTTQLIELGLPVVVAVNMIDLVRKNGDTVDFAKMTLMTTCFMPCGAKAPIIALFAGAIFGHSPLVAASAYFIGIASVILSGIMLKKFKIFAGDPAPFVMELPAYHVPSMGNVLRATWERGWSFIKRAGTIILLSSIILWFLQGFGFTSDGFGMVEDSADSLLAAIGGAVAVIFAPLGFNTWQATVATITGLIAKEEVVGTMSVLYPGNFNQQIALHFTPITTYSFMLFNLLCAPCFAAIGAIKREMNNWKWTLGAVGYMCLWAYVVALVVYQIGGLIAGEVAFGLGTVVAAALVVCVIWLLVRKGYQEADRSRQLSSVAAAAN